MLEEDAPLSVAVPAENLTITETASRNYLQVRSSLWTIWIHKLGLSQSQNMCKGRDPLLQWQKRLLNPVVTNNDKWSNITTQLSNMFWHQREKGEKWRENVLLVHLVVPSTLLLFKFFKCCQSIVVLSVFFRVRQGWCYDSSEASRLSKKNNIIPHRETQLLLDCEDDAKHQYCIFELWAFGPSALFTRPRSLW